MLDESDLAEIQAAIDAKDTPIEDLTDETETLTKTE